MMKILQPCFVDLEKKEGFVCITLAVRTHIKYVYYIVIKICFTQEANQRPTRGREFLSRMR